MNEESEIEEERETKRVYLIHKEQGQTKSNERMRTQKKMIERIHLS